MNAPVRVPPAGSAWRWVDLDDPIAWDDAVLGGGGDVFHRAWFHRLAESRGEGRPRLFEFRGGSVRVALPLLMRPIPGTSDFDATSVYGYAGPVCVGEVSSLDVVGFQAALRTALAAEGIVSVFSRLHPLDDHGVWLRGLGELVPSGSTVSIDLSIGDDDRRAHYRGSHRREIAGLERDGYTVHGEADAVDLFHDLYTATMERVEAGRRYAFSPAHLATMVGRGGMKLLVVRKAADVAAAGLFTTTGAGSHYFLSGTDPSHRKRAPTKLMIERACAWARCEGAAWLHLGGGVGGAEDSLFRFKAGFGPRRHRFLTWRWVVRPTAYRHHCDRVGGAIEGDFFPAYRV